MATKIFIVPDKRSKTSIIKESTGGFQWNNAVMTGRWHKGDENGNTQYEYATLKAVDENGDPVDATIEITDIRFTDVVSESSGIGVIADSGRVIVGRTHGGDQNGTTKYATGIVKVNGKVAECVDWLQSAYIKESSGTWYNTDNQRFIIGRVHKGDENGDTYYVAAKLVVYLSRPAIAPRGTKLIPDVRTVSLTYKESNSSFQCPANTVMTGMYREKDENGSTLYEYATLKAVNSRGLQIAGEITVEDILWERIDSESSGLGFDAPAGRVIVGRKHFGDENEPTWYATGVVKFNGYTAYMSSYTVSEAVTEPSGWYKCDNQHVITARHHHDDENGKTYFGLGALACGKATIPTTIIPFDLVIALHEEEKYYPMNADDFIILSRFRRHIDGGTDMGYDKNTGKFITGNADTSNYYNIPADVIDKYISTVEHKRLFNLRPKDDMNAGSDNVFLQQFSQLCGDTKPNDKVPVYVLTYDYTREDGAQVTYWDFWLFFGYNYAKFVFECSHQGDWEHVMVEVVNGKITGAWHSHHSHFTHRYASELNIVELNGRQQLTIFCAKGSHALYNTPGKHDTDFDPSKDYATDAGYKWKVNDKWVYLHNQPWKNFAGAWGEVGLWNSTTGPLGPWYKRFDFCNEVEVVPSSFASGNDVIIVPDKCYLSEFHRESDGDMIEAPTDMVLIGRRHNGDADGESVYLYASLKAINLQGQEINGSIKVEFCKWSEEVDEISSNYVAPEGYVIIGRQHIGSDEGKTRYKIGRITFNGRETVVSDASSICETQQYMESKGIFFKTNKYLLWTGRVHMGDAKGLTYNLQGYVKVV